MILSEENTMIRDMVGGIAQEHIAGGAETRASNATFPREQLTALADQGILGMLAPEEFGGTGAGYLNFVLAMEEIAAADGALSTILSVHSTPVTTAILKYSTAAQKSHWLPQLTSGDIIGAFALTEAGAGSDAAALKTKAVRDGDEWVINGTKQFITSGQNGGVVIVFAVTDASAGKRGMSAFIVPTHCDGYHVTTIEKKMGQESSDTCALSFENMRIPAENLLGAEGEGYKIALANLEGGRLGISAQSIGMARAAYEYALTYAGERESFGKPLYAHQAVSFKLADMATQIELARTMLHHTANLRDHDMPCTKEACMVKLYASEMAERVIHDALQILGGYGYLKDHPIERIYRDARVCTIYEGTSDIQRMVIGREILKG